MNAQEHAVSRNTPPAPWSKSGITDWAAKLRPLSDIREATEPSLVDIATRVSLAYQTSSSHHPKHNSPDKTEPRPYHTAFTRSLSQRSAVRKVRAESSSEQPLASHVLDSETQSDGSSAYSLSLENVPPRSSSKHKLGLRVPQRDVPIQQMPQPCDDPQCLASDTSQPRYMSSQPNEIRDNSPARQTRQQCKQSTSPKPHHNRKDKSLTYARTTHPNTDILEYPTHHHPKLSVELHVASTLFIAGSDVDGKVRIDVHKLERVRHRRQLAISRVSLDLIGVEEIAAGRRHVFLNLASELIDSEHPPPGSMVDTEHHLADLDSFWFLRSGVSTFDFSLHLPQVVGAPTFHSKRATIRYVLAVTILLRHQSSILSSLPGRLVVADESVPRHAVSQTVKVKARLRRQVWISGSNLFVDISIENRSKRLINRLELHLERDILIYKHTAPDGNSTDAPRIFNENDKAILTRRVYKASMNSEWLGVGTNLSDDRTFDLELPRGVATIRRGIFFEVRYLLNIIVGSSMKHKVVELQLPIVLIHMNSLDLSQSVSRAATALEQQSQRAGLHDETRSARTHVGNEVQRSIFVASPNTPYNTKADLVEIEHILRASPRRFQSLEASRKPGSNPIKSPQTYDMRANTQEAGQLKVPQDQSLAIRGVGNVDKASSSPPRYKLPIALKRSISRRFAQSIEKRPSFASLDLTPATRHAKAATLRLLHRSKLQQNQISLDISRPIPPLYPKVEPEHNLDELPSSKFTNIPGSTNVDHVWLSPLRKTRGLDTWKYPGHWFGSKLEPKNSSAWT